MEVFKSLTNIQLKILHRYTHLKLFIFMIFHIVQIKCKVSIFKRRFLMNLNEKARAWFNTMIKFEIKRSQQWSQKFLMGRVKEVCYHPFFNLRSQIWKNFVMPEFVGDQFPIHILGMQLCVKLWVYNHFAEPCYITMLKLHRNPSLFLRPIYIAANLLAIY